MSRPLETGQSPCPFCGSPTNLDIAYALRQLEAKANNKSEYADAILDFWKLDQDAHRFQIHARVFKGMDLIGYIAKATA